MATTGDGVLPPGEGQGPLRQQARQALARYDQAVRDAGGSGSVRVTPPSWDAYNAPGGIAIESVMGSRTSTQLTVGFTGAEGPATQPCGADYTTEAIESANAVVVIVLSEPHDDTEPCNLMGYPRIAPVSLSEPLGQRAVLEVQQGQPVPLVTSSPS